VIVTPTVVLPAEFDAMTVYEFVDATALGVPEITPVAELRPSPDDSAGETE
jgi:hypothetical protein